MHKLSVIDVLPPEDYRRGYVAGFFDADGFVGLYIRNDRPTPIICFTNTHVHVLNWLRTLVFQLEEIDYIHVYPKSRQIKISRWDQVEKFVNIFKTLCIVKRRQLELLDEAIKKRWELIANRKGRKLYANQDIEAFRKIEQQIKEEKGNIKKHWEFAVKGFFPIFG